MARKSRKVTLPESEQCKKNTAKIWKAALYIRLSVEFNSGHGDSLETQRQIMETYISLCPDIEIKNIYTDNGTTGQNFERMAFKEMLTDIEAGKIDCIVVKDLSRLGRNAIDTGFYIEKYFPLHHVRFISVNDQYDSEGADNSGSHITVPLKNIINEAYCADISKKIRSQVHEAMKSGDYIGARPPYGYKKDPENCHKLLVNEDTAPYVRQMFEWIADGVPLNVVVLRLNEAHVPTPGYYHASIGLITDKRLIGNGKWSSWHLTKMLADQVYVGDMVQGKTTSIHRKQHATPEKDWIVVRGTHEPIISRELFDRVQKARKQVANLNKNKVIVPYTENILKGRIFCGHCGKNLHRERVKDRYSFSCISNQRIQKGYCSAEKTFIREPVLFDIVLSIIQKEAEAVLENTLWLKSNNQNLKAICANKEKKVNALQQEAEKNKRYLATLYENYVAGVLTSQEYLDMKEMYSRKIGEIMDEISELQKSQTELNQKINSYINLEDLFADIRHEKILTASLIKRVVDRITLYSPTDISIDFSFQNDFEQLKEAISDV